MTWTASLLWSSGRAVLLALLAWPCCLGLVRWLDQQTDAGRFWRWWLVAALFLFPELLVGYAYAPWVAGLPWSAEIACSLLMGCRVLPVGVLALWLTPPSPVTPAAEHVRGFCLQTGRQHRDAWRLWWSARIAPAIPALVLMTLVTFQQLELPALLLATSWTDWLFVQQVGGLSLAESLRVSLTPVLLQLGLIAFAASQVARDGSTPTVERRPLVAWETAVVLLLLAASWLLVIVLPLVSLLAGLPQGVRPLLEQPLRWQGLLRELCGGLAISVLAALWSWQLAGVCQRRLQTIWIPLLLVPGLLGSLVLSLALIAAFQQPGISLVYGTPLRWLVGLTLFLLPRAWLLRTGTVRPTSTSEQLASLLSRAPDAHRQQVSRSILWRLRDQPRFFAIVCLVWWAYLDLTTAYLLAPVGLSSGVVRLYNFMHFGRTTALSMEAAVLLLFPWVIAAGVWMATRHWRTA